MLFIFCFQFCNFSCSALTGLIFLPFCFFPCCYIFHFLLAFITSLFYFYSLFFPVLSFLLAIISVSHQYPITPASLSAHPNLFPHRLPCVSCLFSPVSCLRHDHPIPSGPVFAHCSPRPDGEVRRGCRAAGNSTTALLHCHH